MGLSLTITIMQTWLASYISNDWFARAYDKIISIVVYMTLYEIFRFISGIL
jgi:hypothetical protein